VDNNRPLGQRHLGCCIVSAASIVEAVRVAWRLGCNPGGEVAGCEVEPPSPAMIGRLLTKAELAVFGVQV
jgi:hypothetical protein